jgi:hypothetical protein
MSDTVQASLTSNTQIVLSTPGVQGASSVAGFFDVSGTTYTLSESNKSKVGRFTSNSAVTVTVPAGLVIDFNCMILQLGTGQITVAPAAGVTRRAAVSAVKTAYQYAAASVFFIGNNEFLLSGEVSS